MPRWLFLRLLALVYLVAFVSLWTQIDGLVGSRGILPVGDYLAQVHERFGAESYRLLPTLTWLAHSDGALHALCGGGVVLALLLLCGVAPIPVLLALWAVYLSLQISGQIFLGFQWDILLLESGFCALFYAPASMRPRLPWSERPPHPAGRWLMWLLLFKLMVLSGAVKLVCLDRTWWELTALDYHYFTTPLPLGPGWYAHHLPSWFGKLSVLVMFVVEIGVPFLIFGPRRLRIAAAIVEILFQVAIAATGNYGFFNLLTVVLCVPLFDGRSPAPAVRAGRVARIAPAVLVPAIVLVSGVSFVQEIVRTAPRPRIDGWAGSLVDAGDRYVLSWGDPLLDWIAPFNTINGYGLFRAMTTTRPEIVIEASADGQSWREYEFRWKPGDVMRRPALAAPHMPRLDWQMWFAALNPGRHQAWLERLLLRLLEGSPEVVALLGPPPFPGPPRSLRLAYYEYEFTRPGESGWWKRKFVGYLRGHSAFSSNSYGDGSKAPAQKNANKN